LVLGLSSRLLSEQHCAEPAVCLPGARDDGTAQRTVPAT
jgi:hypothetical protein